MLRFVDIFRGGRAFLALASLVAVLLVGFVPPASAQEVSAGITGVVSDPSGAAMVGATVVAKEASRGFEYTTETNAVGVYVFPRIPGGTYDLTVEAQGFRKYVQSGLLLEVNQRARIDINMQLGAVTETIEVTGEIPLLNTETTIVGQTVDTINLTETPLASRNYIELTLLTPGTTTTSLAGMRDSQRSGYGQSRPYVNGNRAQANNFLLDGIDNNQVSDNYTAYQPNVDAIQEVKMITNNASAEFGNFQGGIMNIIMKGGTNQFHGSAFEFFQNDKLNANNWARNWQGLDRTPVRLNTFGGTFGGPILRDKLFFFANYQAIRRSNPPANANFDVFPSAFRQGDFSQLLSDRNLQLYDYLTTASDGTRQPFANNQIPLSRIDPVAANLFSRTDLYPQPLNGGLEFNQLNRLGNTLKTDQGDLRADYKPGVMDDIMFRYSQGRQDVPTVNSQPLLFGSLNQAPFKAAVINWTKTIGPTFVNEARFGVNRIILDNGGADFNNVGNVAEELGITGANDRGPGLPAIQFPNGRADNIGSQNVGTQALFANTTFHLADNMTHIRGRHTVKFGGQWLQQRMNTLYTGNTGRTGFIAFDGRFTGASQTTIGSSEADFFLGAVSRTGRGVTNLWGHRKYILGFYVQDDWRATDKLTLNLGLRWEYHDPLKEVYDRQANFSPFTGEIQLAGQDGNSRALYNTFNKDFQPRFGFAYSLTDKMVLRGAYTISSYMEGTGTNLRLPINPPFQIETEARFDDGSFAQPAISTGEAISAQSNPTDPFRNANIRLWDPNVRPANTQQWSLIAENQVSANTMVSVGYVGQKGHHLVVPMPYFQRQLQADGSTVASPYLSGNPALARISQISGTETNGNMQYHALQFNTRRRMESGFTYQVAYTYSKTMTDSLGFYGDVGQIASNSAYWQYLYDSRAEWGPAFFDATHNFTGSFVYELPFGRGRSYGGDWGSGMNGVLGGWQLGGIVYGRSGFASTIRADDVSGTGSRGYRADRVGDGTDGPRIVGPGGEWFETSAYRQPLAGTVGSAGNGTFRGPRLFDTSLSLQKFFPVREGHSLQFRAEAFNITNTPAFQSITTNVNNVNFGQVRGSQGERRFQLALKYIF
jgi:hypothetical protein